MIKKKPGHRSVASTVWALSRQQGSFIALVGTYSTPDKARTEAGKIIASEAGIASIRLPHWASKEDGFELVYGRDNQSWRFTVLPSIVDGVQA